MTVEDDARAAYARGASLYEQRDLSGAYAALQQSDAIMFSAIAHRAMGTISREQGDCQRALRHFQTALQSGEDLPPQAQGDFDHCVQQVGELLPVTGEAGKPLEEKAKEIFSAVAAGITDAFGGAAQTLGLPSGTSQNGEEASPEEPPLQVNQASMLPAGALPWVAGGLVVLAAGAGVWALWPKKG